MSDLANEFKQAQQDIAGLQEPLSTQDMLALHAHYQQATAGDISGKRPAMSDMSARARFDAWEKLKGMGPETAMWGYITKARAVLQAGYQ